MLECSGTARGGSHKSLPAHHFGPPGFGTTPGFLGQVIWPQLGPSVLALVRHLPPANAPQPYSLGRGKSATASQRAQGANGTLNPAPWSRRHVAAAPNPALWSRRYRNGGSKDATCPGPKKRRPGPTVAQPSVVAWWVPPRGRKRAYRAAPRPARGL
jgi:hypothetical protein